MIGPAGEYDVVAEKRLEDDAPVLAGRTYDAQLELSLGHPLDDGLGIENGKGDRDSR